MIFAFFTNFDIRRFLVAWLKEIMYLRRAVNLNHTSKKLLHKKGELFYKFPLWVST